MLPKVAKATMKAKMSAISQHDIADVFACKLQTLQMDKSLKGLFTRPISERDFAVS
jgi:hypothetical protein